jgi:hypothetical protein
LFLPSLFLSLPVPPAALCLGFFEFSWTECSVRFVVVVAVVLVAVAVGRCRSRRCRRRVALLSSCSRVSTGVRPNLGLLFQQLSQWGWSSTVTSTLGRALSFRRLGELVASTLCTSSCLRIVRLDR